MIYPEWEYTYEMTVGNVRYIVISETPRENRHSIFDALTELMVRDYSGEFAEAD